jgi:hypothetical protein
MGKKQKLKKAQAAERANDELNSVDASPEIDYHRPFLL